MRLVDHDLKNNAGITLIELLLAVAILGLLVAIALPSYNRYVERTKIAAAVTDIAVAQMQIDAFYVDNNRLPTSLDEVGLGSMWKRGRVEKGTHLFIEQTACLLAEPSRP